MSWCYRYVMRGRLRAKKNGKRILFNRSSGRPFIASSSAYQTWAKDAEMQIRIQRGRTPTIPRGVPVAIHVVVYLARGQHALDDDNAVGGPFDVLEAAGIVANDNQFRLAGPPERRRDWSDPRVEVTLTPYV